MSDNSTSEGKLPWYAHEMDCPKSVHTPERSKNWTMVLYPEDCPDNWYDILSELKLTIVVSPLHDQDVRLVDDGEGNQIEEKKKAHHHLAFVGRSSWITYKTLQELGRQLIGVALPNKLSSVEGMVRYFTHIDNPDKHQYAQEDIKVIGNLDIEQYFKLSKKDKDEIQAQILRYCRENEITEFSDLIDYCIEEQYEWYRFISVKGWLIEKYVASMRGKKRIDRTRIEQNAYIDALAMIVQKIQD